MSCATAKKEGSSRYASSLRARSTRLAGSVRERAIAPNAAKSFSPIANSIACRHAVMSSTLSANQSRKPRTHVGNCESPTYDRFHGIDVLGYAGGSRRSPQPIDGGDPGPAGIFHRKPFACNFGQGRNRHRRNDADHKRHVPAWLLDVVGQSALGVVYGMSMDRAVGVPVSNEMAVSAASVMKSKAEIIVAGVSGRGFRCGNADALERKGQRRRHHDDDGSPSKERSPREAQRSGPSMVTRLSYTVAGIGRTSAPALSVS